MGDKFKIANNLHSKSQKLAAVIQKWCFKKFYKKSKVKLNASKKILIISKSLTIVMTSLFILINQQN